MLKVVKVSKEYDSGRGIKNITFTARPGKIVGILGNNGCGKSTIFRSVLGLLNIDSGTILFQNKAINRDETRLFGYLPEERSMLRNLSVYEQIVYLCKLKKMTIYEIDTQLDYWLDYLHIEQYRHQKIMELSKGNQQKVQIICAVIHNPKIMILDEPLNGLDIDNVALFKRLLVKLKKEKKVILLSSHQYHNIENYCDQIVYLRSGSVVFKGDILKMKKKFEKRFLHIYSDKVMFEDEPGVLDVQQDGKYVILEMKSQESSYRLIHKLQKMKIEDFAMRLTSLQNIIEEYQG